MGWQFPTHPGLLPDVRVVEIDVGRWMCERAGLGNEPRRVLAEQCEICEMDVVLPTRQGVEIRKRCISKPTEHQEILLERLALHLPSKFKQSEM